MRFEAILRAHLARYPAMQIQDVYKLVHQAALGSEHAAPDPLEARRWLEQEVAGLGKGLDDPMLENISPDARLVRVNLRPYLAEGGSLEALLQAFLRTAVDWQGEHETLHRYTGWAVELAEVGHLAFPVVEMREYFQRLAQAGFPAAHHSAGYREAYRPAYRVVMRANLPPIDP